MPGNLADIITCAKFQDEIFKDYNFIGVKFPMYLLIFAIGPSLRGNTSFEPQSVKSVRFDLEKKGKKDSHCTDSNGGYLRRRHHVCKFQHEIFRDYNFTTSNFPYSLSWRFAIFAPSLWFFATKTVLLWNLNSSKLFRTLFHCFWRLAIAIAIVHFLHTAPIYADVFSIFYHSLQLSCSRNNTKMARANYEIFVQF